MRSNKLWKDIIASLVRRADYGGPAGAGAFPGGSITAPVGGQVDISQGMNPVNNTQMIKVEPPPKSEKQIAQEQAIMAAITASRARGDETRARALESQLAGLQASNPTQ